MPYEKQLPHSPRLSPEQERAQRGIDPAHPWKQARPVAPSVDPEADRETIAKAHETLEKLWRGRPHARAALAPKLLIRACPGDHGVRAPEGPTPFWESPDIHVVPAVTSQPPSYDPHTHTYGGQAPTLRPQVGHPHWVFVHVWNLGPLAAFGVTVSAWWADPTFAFDLEAADPSRRPHLIGERHRLELPARNDPSCHRRICVGRWTPITANHGHECLLAKVTCMADGSPARSLDAHRDRHVGQRNLHVVEPDEDLTPLMARLDTALPDGADLELLHGLHDLHPLLVAHHPVLAKTIHPPVAVAKLSHLGMMKAVAPRLYRPLMLSHPPVPAPSAALLKQLGAVDLKARTVAARLNVIASAAAHTGHVLRFRASRNGQVLGGYTVIVHA